jgi:NhaA family Na+:H+ antiporter
MTDLHAHSPLSREHILVQRLREFLRLETAAGFVLVAAAVLAMIVANSPLANLYHDILNDVHFVIGLARSGGEGFDWSLNKSILHWINDGLMVIFFFLVGLEIKREFKEGQLSSRDRALLPLVGAIGGMAVPALIFYAMTHHDPELVRGWAIPAATDIAFTLGVLALLGKRVPLSLKILVTAIAVIDDLGAIVVIALFYTNDLQVQALYFAVLVVVALFFMNRWGVGRPAIFILVGFVLWVAVLKSGVHATLAGVITALCIPMRHPRRPHERPVEDLEHVLHPWVAFFILPLFAFANAGISLSGVTVGQLGDPVTLGIILGLFVGKQVGIFAALWACIRYGWSPKPQGASWAQMYGVAILCGIGFTMSLFIGGLAYTGALLQVEVRLGVIIGSILSAGAGYALLRYAADRQAKVYHA